MVTLSPQTLVCQEKFKLLIINLLILMVNFYSLTLFLYKYTIIIGHIYIVFLPRTFCPTKTQSFKVHIIDVNHWQLLNKNCTLLSLKMTLKYSFSNPCITIPVRATLVRDVKCIKETLTVLKGSLIHEHCSSLQA